VRGEEEEEFSTGQNVEEEDKDISKIKMLDIIFLSGLVVDVSADGWTRSKLESTKSKSSRSSVDDFLTGRLLC
jgi:hypothetical protein